jgi:hypothetical protein
VNAAFTFSHPHIILIIALLLDSFTTCGAFELPVPLQQPLTALNRTWRWKFPDVSELLVEALLQLRLILVSHNNSIAEEQ